MQLNGISSFRKSLRALERVLEHGHIFGPACCDITVAQCHALLEVDRCNGTAMGDLASALDVDRSTATRFIDELVKAGLADRSRTDADRRAVRVVLTPIISAISFTVSFCIMYSYLCIILYLSFR